MAVGDTTNGMTPANTATTFQPAAGVEWCITAVFSVSGASWGLTDGTNNCYTTGVAQGTYRLSFFVNNTRYLVIGAQGVGVYGGYSGVITK